MKPLEKTTARVPATIIESIDGRAYVGESPRAALQAMRMAGWGCPEPSLRRYMQAVAARVMQWNKSPVRVTSVDEFLSDLEAAGIVVVRSAS
jgi:hypothetical protein